MPAFIVPPERCGMDEMRACLLGAHVNRNFPAQVLHSRAEVPSHHTECTYVLADLRRALIAGISVTTH